MKIRVYLKIIFCSKHDDDQHASEDGPWHLKTGGLALWPEVATHFLSWPGGAWQGKITQDFDPTC